MMDDRLISSGTRKNVQSEILRIGGFPSKIREYSSKSPIFEDTLKSYR